VAIQSALHGRIKEVRIIKTV